MNKLLLPVLLTTFPVAGQTCVRTDLSKSLLFKTEITRFKRADTTRDSCLIRTTVSRKQAPASSLTLVFSTIELSASDYTNCNWTRSYATGKRTKNNGAMVLYEDQGDLVVGDFNFDGRDDFAAKRESPNGGTQYNYYVQQKNGEFRLDKFLTEKVGYAPNRLSTANRTLQTFAHAGVRYGETTFRFNPKNNTWKEIRHLFFRYLPPGYPEPNQ